MLKYKTIKAQKEENKVYFIAILLRNTDIPIIIQVILIEYKNTWNI